MDRAASDEYCRDTRQVPRNRSAGPLRRDRRGRKTPSPIRRRRRPISSRCATCFAGARPVVLRPGSVAEVAEILKLANETATAIVPQGGNTGLVGGQIPHHGEIVLSLNRLDRIREVDPVSNTMTCEAGVTLLRAREAAADGRPALIRSCCRRRAPARSAATSPPMPAAPPRWPTASRARTRSASRWCCADGARVERPQQAQEGQYRLRPQGPVHRRRRHARRHHRGGAASWCRGRARSRPPSSACRRRQAALDLLGLATERTAGGVTSFELMLRMGIELVLRHGARLPRSAAAAASLVRADRALVAGPLRLARRAGGNLGRRASSAAWSNDATIAESLEQAKMFWRIREMFGEVQTPRRRLDQARRLGAGRRGAGFHRGGERRRRQADPRLPGRCRSAISATATSTTTSPSPWAPTRPSSSRAGTRSTRPCSAVVAKHGGSISAEHGIGVMKRDLLPQGEGPGRVRPDAHAQAHARSQGHPQSGQGAVASPSCAGLTAHPSR